MYLRFISLLAAAVVAGAAGAAPSRTLIVSAPDRDYHDALCSTVLTPPANAPSVILHLGKQAVPVQTRRVGKKLQLTWMVHELPKGKTLKYTASFRAKPLATPKDEGVRVVRQGRNLQILVNGALFTRYDTTTGPNKPYFWPIYGPDSKLMVRSFPMVTVPGETRDHPHHRGLWFTHGAVNGLDFWGEESKAAFTKNTGYQGILSGPVYGEARASTDWVDRAGKKQLEDTRQFTVFGTPDAIVLDFDVTLKASNGPVRFGDTKEGSFGIRVPDSMRVKGGDGHMLASTGLTDGAVWSTRADWVDYWGTVEGETVGIAIFDNPHNFRHPTYWHARDYGLFAANPFGVHDFVKGQPKDAGNYTLPAGKTLTFRYRVIFHRGDATQAGIGDAWGAYIDPPHVTVK